MNQKSAVYNRNISTIMKEGCTKLFLETIVDITEEIKKDILKIEKGSLDKDFRDQVIINARSYLKLLNW